MTELAAGNGPYNIFLGSSPNNEWVVLSPDLSHLDVYPSAGCGSPPPSDCPLIAESNQRFQNNDSGAFSLDSTLFGVWSNPSNTTTALGLLNTGTWGSVAPVTLAGVAGTLAFSPSGSTVADAYLATTNGNSDFSVLETRSTTDLSVTQTLSQFAGPVGLVAFSHNSQMFATAGNVANFGAEPPPFVKIWNANTGSLLQTIAITCGGNACAGGAVSTLAFSLDDSSVLVGGIGGVNLYNISTGALTKNLIPASTHSLPASLSPDGSEIAFPNVPYTGANGTFELHSASDGSLIVQSPISSTWGLAAPVFAPDGNSVFAVSYSGGYFVQQLSTTGLSAIRNFTSGLFQSVGINSIAASANGSILAVGTNDNRSAANTGRVVLFRVSDGTLLTTLVGNTTSVSTLAFSPDGQTLAAGDYNANIFIWRVSDGTLLRLITRRPERASFRASRSSLWLIHWTEPSLATPDTIDRCQLPAIRWRRSHCWGLLKSPPRLPDWPTAA